ncbi:MAG: hypothetical protein JHD38_03805 [Mycolicibacterium sp.]|nr:hypothetical protein [Mycolicibacterium sp.]
MGTALDEQRDVVADRAGDEVFVGLRDGGADLFRGHVGETFHESVLDVRDLFTFIDLEHVEIFVDRRLAGQIGAARLCSHAV